MEVKQAIIFRADLAMSPGKMVAQGAHAAVEAALKAPSNMLTRWAVNGVTKVVLVVPDEATIHELHRQAVANNLPCGLIRDEGRTEVEPGSLTALAIGPGYIDSITGRLPLFKTHS